jgi:hypothetical protein
MPVTDSSLHDLLRPVLEALRSHYGARFSSLVALPQSKSELLEVLVVIHDPMNTMRELLRVEPVARRYSSTDLELSLLPVAKSVFDAALEPGLWEAHVAGVVID